MAASPQTAPTSRSIPPWHWTVPDGAWTYDLYRNLPEDGNRYEVIDGRLLMSPSPGRGHQQVSRNLEWILTSWTKALQTGEVYAAPFDVIFATTGPRQQIVQPDILFVARDRLSILTDLNVQGPPDLIVEILSPGTERQDWKDKKTMYERYGVPHYWLVDPNARYLVAFRLEEGTYREAGRFFENDTFEPEGFPGLRISLAMIWD